MKPFKSTDKPMTRDKKNRSKNALKAKWSRTENNNFERVAKKGARQQGKRDINFNLNNE